MFLLGVFGCAVQCEDTAQIFAKQAKGDAVVVTSYTEEYHGDFAPVCVLNVLSRKFLFDINWKTRR
jgi:hypothetical protein